MENLTGRHIDRYEILELLGKGGMAMVYKAYDTRLEREVAIKIIRRDAFPPENLHDVLKRFEREAKSLARLSHPNIVKVLDYGEYEGSPFLVLEYFSGGTLKQKIGESISWQEAARLMLPIARGIEYAHLRGVIHRDIKPANVLLAENGEPTLSDFGIAKLFQDENVTTLTGSGAAIGTPEYMAPEQWTGQTSPKSDMYSLGVILYEMITGRRPYIADTPGGVFLKQVTEPLPFPRQIVPNLPESVERFLLKALAKDPADRYADLGSLIKELESLLGNYNIRAQAPVEEVRAKTAGPGPVSEVPVSSTPIFPNPYRRMFILGGVGAAIIIALIIGFPQLQGIFTSAPTSMPTHPITAIETASPTVAPTFTDMPEVVSATTTITPVASPTAALGIGSTWIRPADGMEMVYVPEGEFTMGVAKSYTDESPPHTVYLNAFWVDKTEVTAIMYKQCVNGGICRPYSEDAPAQNNDAHATNISWFSANDYCTWAGGRLPTEAEWEKAARGGLEGKKYPWGDEPPLCASGVFNGALFSSCGNYPDDSVYSSGINGYGLYGMAGGVWEWVSDWYGANYYTNSPQNNPPGPADGKLRVLRGGSFTSPAENIRVALRHSAYPNQTNGDLGFRCVRDVNP